MGIITNARVRRRARQEPRERTSARREFKTHTIQPAEVQAFTFRRENGDSNHWFRLTWSPGHLSLVGDIGDLTLTHYSTLASFEGGIRWAARADYQYLMEKSDKATVKKLDRKETVEDILRMTADDAAYARVEELREARRHKRLIQAATADWEQDLADWGRAPYRSEERRPRLADYWPEAEPRARFIRDADRADWGSAVDRLHTSHMDRQLRRWQIPDGWHGWMRLMIVLEHDLDFEDPNQLLTPSGRRAVAKALADHLDGDMHENDVAEFCRELGFDDYYGAYRYSGRTIWQIEAIQHGCNLILDQLEPRRAWGRTWADPVV